METITITQKSETVNKYEIELPAYLKFSESYLQIISENKVTEVSNFSFDLGITLKDRLPLLDIYTPSTKEEFETAYNQVLAKIQNTVAEIKSVDSF